MKPPVKLELLNQATGTLLLFAALFSYYRLHELATALNWGIFGAMYLVMDECSSFQAENRGSWLRYVFGWIGLAGSAVLVCYYLLLRQVVG